MISARHGGSSVTSRPKTHRLSAVPASAPRNILFRPITDERKTSLFGKWLAGTSNRHSFKCLVEMYNKFITGSEGFDHLALTLDSVIETALDKSEGFIVLYQCDESPDLEPNWGLFAKDLDVPFPSAHRKAILHRNFRFETLAGWHIFDPATQKVLDIDIHTLSVKSVSSLERLRSTGQANNLRASQNTDIQSLLQEKIIEYVRLKFPERRTAGSVISRNVDCVSQLTALDGGEMYISIVSEGTTLLCYWKWASNWTLDAKSKRCHGRMSFSYENLTAVNGHFRQHRDVDLGHLDDNLLDVVNRIAAAENETQRAIVDWLRFWSEDGWGMIFKDLYNPSSAFELEIGREKFCRELAEVMATKGAYVISLNFLRDGGPISNLQILKSPRESPVTAVSLLRTDLTQGIDYDVYSENTWLEVSKTVGFDVEIPRKVYTAASGRLKVEIQPISLTINVGFPDDSYLRVLPPCGRAQPDSGPAELNEDVATSVYHEPTQPRLGGFRDYRSRGRFMLNCFVIPRDLAKIKTILNRSLEDLAEYFVRAEFGAMITDSVLISRTDFWEVVLKLVREKFGFEETSLIEHACWLISDSDQLFQSDDEEDDDEDWFSLSRVSKTAAWHDLTVRQPGTQETAPDIDSAKLFIWLPLEPLRILELSCLNSVTSVLKGEQLLETYLSAGGLTGLNNLGNTCFMNSALQCLAHTLPLTRYYLSGKYAEELNLTNPLGMKGVLARTYANFLMKYWNPDTTTLAPTLLKSVIGKFAPNFQGYVQQDAQELLGFLLDGLHEDNNRIKKKPYTPVVEGDDGADDSTVADDAWKRLKLRDDSIILDLFQGQYRSRLECPACGHVSKTFDPFLSCSLPVPQSTKFALIVRKFANSTTIIQIYIFLWKNQLYPISCILIVDYRSDLAPVRLFASRQTPNFQFLTAFLEAEDAQIRTKLGDHLDQNRDKIRKEFERDDPIPSIDEFELDVWWASIDEAELSGDDRFCHVIAYPRNVPLISINVPLPCSITLGLCSLALESKTRDSKKSTALSDPVTDSSPYPSTGGPSTRAISSITLMMTLTDTSKNEIVMAVSKLISEQLGCPNLTDDYKSWEATICNHESDGVAPVYRVQLTDIGGFWESRAIYYRGNRDSRTVFLNDQLWKTMDLGCCYKDDLEATRTEAHVPIYTAGRTDIESACIAGLQGDGITLYDCFSAFVGAENLEEDNKWYCGKCKDFVCANKKMDFWRLPRILVVHLKRFQLKNRGVRSKICTAVEFPWRDDEILDLARFTQHSGSTPANYKMFGVSAHYGGLGGGHYTATVRCEIRGRPADWYTFDDTRVVSPDGGEAMYESCYILFYESIL